MDSITQAALGAAVGVAIMGRTRPAWQAALAGALVGSLPDLDVLLDQGDPLRNMVLHRAQTHALFYQALAAPLIAGVAAALTRSRALYARWVLMVLLTLWSHSWLDVMTVYGTRIGLPFTDHPFGLGSLFIIDPLYTLPLLLGLAATLLRRGPPRRRANAAGLALSTLYAVWAVAAQAHVTDRVRQTPIARDLPPAHILVTPTPFNTLFWRIVLLDGAQYHEGFHSLLDPLTRPGQSIRFDSFDRGRDWDHRTAGFADADLLRAFSKGFYALADDGRRVRITDLRMGQAPYYVFAFEFAEHQSAPLVPITPVRVGRRLPPAAGLAWLAQRIPGGDRPPPR